MMHYFCRMIHSEVASFLFDSQNSEQLLLCSLLTKSNNGNFHKIRSVLALFESFQMPANMIHSSAFRKNSIPVDKKALYFLDWTLSFFFI